MWITTYFLKSNKKVKVKEHIIDIFQLLQVNQFKCSY